MATYSCHTDVCEPKGGVDGDNSTRSKAARLFRLGVFSLVLGVQRINGGLDVCVLDPGSGKRPASNAEHAGAAIRATIGMGLVAFFWVASAVILGVFSVLTRSPKMIITEEES